MKKISLVLAVLLTVLSLCSCGKKPVSQEDIPIKEYEDYDNYSTKGYSLKYDDNLFNREEIDGCDVFTLNGSDDRDTYIKIETFKNAQLEKTVKDIEKSYEDKGLAEISTVKMKYFNVEDVMDISAFTKSGDRIFETFAVQNRDEIICVSYSYSTSLNQVSVANAIDSLIHSFTLK